MTANRTRAFALALAAALQLAVAWADDTKAPLTAWPANVGPARLELPVPAGYVESTLVAAELREFGEKLCPPGNRLLAYFVDEAEVAAVRANAGSNFNRYFLVQTLRQTENSKVSEAEFAAARKVLREQYQQLLTRVADLAKDQVQSAVDSLKAHSGSQVLDLKLGEFRGLEVFIDEKDDISMLAATKVAVVKDSGTVETPLVVAINTALIGGKLLYLYVYSSHSGDQDLEWLRTQSRLWLEQARALNR